MILEWIGTTLKYLSYLVTIVAVLSIVGCWAWVTVCKTRLTYWMGLLLTGVLLVVAAILFRLSQAVEQS